MVLLEISTSNENTIIIRVFSKTNISFPGASEALRAAIPRFITRFYMVRVSKRH
jgi:hypothetical protein